MNGLVLNSEGLLSKWGFSDGDEPDWLLDLLDERGLSYPSVDDWHAVLRRLVREHLLPVLDQRVDVVDVETNHNPIRAVAVDGIDVRERSEMRLTPESVVVPVAEVLRVLAEVRP